MDDLLNFLVLGFIINIYVAQTNCKYKEFIMKNIQMEVAYEGDLQKDSFDSSCC